MKYISSRLKCQHTATYPGVIISDQYAGDLRILSAPRTSSSVPMLVSIEVRPGTSVLELGFTTPALEAGIGTPEPVLRSIDVRPY